jgi:ATPase family associated with various cellular activities (AAA)
VGIHLCEDFLSAESFLSRISGAGKSFAVRRVAHEHFSAYEHVPVFDVASSVDRLCDRLLETQAAPADPWHTTRTWHLDVYSTTGPSFNSHLFELCFLGGLVRENRMQPMLLDAQHDRVAVEVASGAPTAALGVARLLSRNVLLADERSFCADPKGLRAGMGAHYSSPRFDGTADAKRSAGLTAANAFQRLQYVCVALHTIEELEGRFPYLFDGPAITMRDSLRLSQSLDVDSATQQLSAARCYQLLLRASDLDRSHLSLWCLWNFVNVLYWQLRAMHLDGSAINAACLAVEPPCAYDDAAQLPAAARAPTGKRQPDKCELSLHERERVKAEFVRMASVTARLLATRRPRHHRPPHRIVALHAGGEQWLRLPVDMEGRPCFQLELGSAVLYYRSEESRWVETGGVFSFGTLQQDLTIAHSASSSVPRAHSLGRHLSGTWWQRIPLPVAQLSCEWSEEYALATLTCSQPDHPHTQLLVGEYRFERGDAHACAPQKPRVDMWFLGSPVWVNQQRGCVLRQRRIGKKAFVWEVCQREAPPGADAGTCLALSEHPCASTSWSSHVRQHRMQLQLSDGERGNARAWELHASRLRMAGGVPAYGYCYVAEFSPEECEAWSAEVAGAHLSETPSAATSATQPAVALLSAAPPSGSVDEAVEDQSVEEIFADTFTWNESPHSYMVFSNESASIRLLDMPILPAYSVRRVVASNCTVLCLQGGEVVEQEKLRTVLSELTGCDNDPAALLDGRYCLTADNLRKLIAVYTRVRCGLPVLLMGECGCGKTMLVRFLCAWLHVAFFVLDINGGTSAEDIVEVFARAEAVRCPQERQDTRDRVFVFLDEINTCPHMGLITEVICNRTLHGQPISDRVVVIGALNPHRKRPPSRDEDQVGLVFRPQGTCAVGVSV